LIHILPEGSLPAALALLLDVQRENGVGPAALYISTTDQNSRSLITTKCKKFFQFFLHSNPKQFESRPALTKTERKKRQRVSGNAYGQGQIAHFICTVRCV
jgi:hypothetical protein